MTRALTLEDFDRAPPPRAPASPGAPPAPGLTQIDLEEERLAAFDKGYRAGWDDAAAAHAEEQSRISVELARNLEDLSFTYLEAHAALVKESREIFSGMVEKVLPAALGEALGALIVERAADAVTATGATAEIVVAPQNAGRVAALLEGRQGPPLRVVPEASLGEGQAFLRFGQREEKIDLEAVMSEIAEAVTHFLAGGAAPAAAAEDTPTQPPGDTGSSADTNEEEEARYA